MGETLRNAWRVPELRKKLIYTFLMLLLFRLIGVVPVPGIDLNAIQSSIANYDALGLVNMMTGNQFSQAVEIVGGLGKLMSLIESGEVEADKPLNVQNSKWRVKADQVLKHCKMLRR